MDSFLAVISPVEVSDGHPSHPIVIPPGGTVPPLEIWGDIEMPEHPIVLPPGGPPLVIWGDIETPAHPIVIPPGATPLPPEVWPGPGTPTHPISPGGGPSHPIVFPPEIQHPIVIPPGVEPPKSFTVIIYNPETEKWVKVSFVPGDLKPGRGPK
jgi:hypothetical protein